MANCPQCNTPYDPGTIFCDNCGASLAAAAPAGAPAQPVYQPPVQPQQPVYQPPAQPMPTAAYPAAGGAAVCAQCSAPLAPGAVFCDNCGAPAGPAQPVYQPPQPTYQPPVQPQQPVYQPPVQPQQPAGYSPPQQYGPAPRLVVQTTNAQIMLPPGKAEYIVGREDPVSNVFPDVDMTPHGGDDGGVSRRHARLFQQGGQWFVEDYQSTNFTHVNNVRVQPGAPAPVPNGAEIRFGRVKLTFYVQ